MNEPKRKFNCITDTPLWMIVVICLIFGTLTAIGFGAFVLYCIHYAKT